MFARFRFAAWLFAALIAAGCSSPTSLPSIDSAAVRGLQSASATAVCAKPFEFVLDSAAGTVTMYSQSKKCGQMSYGFVQAQGIAVDASDNLYVVDTGSSSVFVFKPPYTKPPFKTYKDPGEYPAGVAACSGYVAVTNVLSSTGGAGSVTIYRDGKATIISDPKVESEYFAACDANGNLYTDGRSTTGAGIVNEFAGGKAPAKDLTAIKLSFPGGLAWKSGALWVEDQTAKTVGLWKPPFTKAEKTIALSGAIDPVDLAVSPNGDRILTADAGLNAAEFYNLTGQNTGSLPGPADAVAYSI